MDGIISSGDDSLTERQFRSFEAIKRKNIGRISDVSFLDTTTDPNKLIAIAKNTGCWLDREQILEEVNKDPGEFIPLSTLNTEILQLMKKGIIDRQKPPKARSYVYAVTTLSAGSPLKRPSPSDIDDPVFHKKPIEVLNPLTGKKVTI